MAVHPAVALDPLRPDEADDVVLVDHPVCSLLVGKSQEFSPSEEPVKARRGPSRARLTAVGILYVIRHGETELNARRVVQPPATPLSERGRGQARRLAERLAGEDVGRILSSDLARARLTAEALQQATGAPLELEPLLQERNFGAVRGTAYADLGFDLFAPDYHPPEGENWEQFEARVDLVFPQLEALAARTVGALAVVTHGLVCRSLAARHLGAGEENEEPRRWGNTSLTVAEGPRPWRVLLLNCTAHLKGAVTDDIRAPSGI